MSEPIHIISLGAGVQSSTMALMAARGEITPMPKAAIFADTGDEPKVVYRWLRELQSKLPFEVHRALHPRGRLSDNLINDWEHSQIPAFFRSDSGEVSIGKRQCTKNWKITPINHKVRELFPKQSVIMWLGISTDEVSRAKDSRVKWLQHRFPLLEARMSRQECLTWLTRRHIANVPKSACVFCPYQSNRQWREHANQAGDWAQILKIDAMLNKRGEYLHKSATPISTVDLSTEEERGQINLFNNECEGLCGV